MLKYIDIYLRLNLLFVATHMFVINIYIVISTIQFQRISQFKFVENVEIDWKDIEMLLKFVETSGPIWCAHRFW